MVVTDIRTDSVLIARSRTAHSRTTTAVPRLHVVARGTAVKRRVARPASAFDDVHVDENYLDANAANNT